MSVALKRVILAGLIVVASQVNFAPAYAEEECSDTTGSIQKVQGLINAWKAGPAGSGFVEAAAQGQKSLFEGIANNPFNQSNNKWAKARSVTFNAAMLDAQSKFVQEVGVQITNESVKKYYSDQSEVSERALREKVTPKPQNNMIARVFDKAGVAAEKWLDKYMTDELGADQEDVDALTPKQRLTVFENSIVQTTKKKAAGQVAGLVPVKSFEAVDCQGNSAIGVIVIQSAKMSAIAKAIASGGQVAETPEKAGKPITEQLQLNDQNRSFTEDFGVRLLRDENGGPVVVSFGQWAYATKDVDSKKIARKYDHARRQAADAARANMAEFLAGRASHSSVSSRGTEENNSIDLLKDSIEEFDEANIVDVSEETVKIKSQIKLTGLTDVKTWSVRKADNQATEIVGVISIWSPSTKRRIEKSISPAVNGNSGGSAKSRATQSESTVEMDANDF